MYKEAPGFRPGPRVNSAGADVGPWGTAARARDARHSQLQMLGQQVQQAMATTGVHYLQRYVLRHVVRPATTCCKHQAVGI